MTDYVALANRVMTEIEERRQSREWTLKGHAVELWWRGNSLWIVADEEDAALLGEPRGRVFARAEMEHLCTIQDPEVVDEIRRLKKQFNGRVREYRSQRKGNNGDSEAEA